MGRSKNDTVTPYLELLNGRQTRTAPVNVSCKHASSLLICLLLSLFLNGAGVEAAPQGWRAGGKNGVGCARADALVNDAVATGTGGDVQKAWQLLELALQHCPQHPSALGNLGYLNAILGNRSLARRQLEEALLGDPGLMEPWVNLGNIIKDEQEAEMALEGGIDDKKHWSQVWRFYRTAFRLNRQQVDITANMAGLYAMTRDWEQTAHFATRSLKLEFTEEAFCALMKALDNICDWDHPLRDEQRLIALLKARISQALANPASFSRHKLCYNAGTAALISDLPPHLVLNLARAEMAVTAANVTSPPHTHSRLEATLLPLDRRLRLAVLSYSVYSFYLLY